MRQNNDMLESEMTTRTERRPQFPRLAERLGGVLGIQILFAMDLRPMRQNNDMLESEMALHVE